MEFLSDEILLEAFKRSIDLNLDDNFIELLSEEIEKRKLYCEES